MERHRIEQAVNDPRLTRAMRALMGLVNRQLKVTPFILKRVWSIESTMSGKPRQYMVAHNAEGWVCTCPDFQKRGQDCKHILAVKLIEERRI